MVLYSSQFTVYLTDLKVTRGVPDVQGDVLVVQDRLMSVHFGHFRLVVHDEAARAVPHDQGWLGKKWASGSKKTSLDSQSYLFCPRWLDPKRRF